MAAVTGIVTSISILVGTVLTFDARYVHASALEEFKQEHVRTIQQVTKDNQSQITQLRRQTLEDKIFELDVKRGRSPTERAILDRYKRELDKVSPK